MTNAPQISVLLPAYNHERYIASAVESLLSQSIDNLEVLAVDDGSTDNTGYILNELAKKDRRLKVFHQENRGVVAALNVALQEASGQWIASCGSDDIVPPNAYRILLRHSSAADVVIGEFSEITDKGRRIRVHLPFGTTCFSALFAMPAMWNKLIRREFLMTAELQFPDVLLCEDLILLAQLAALHPRYTAVRRDVYHYRNDPTAYCSMTHQSSLAYILAHIKGRRRVAEISAAAGMAEGLQYVYQTSLPFLADFLFTGNSTGEAVFQAMQELLVYGRAYIDEWLFERIFFISASDFLKESYKSYRSRICRIPHEEFILRKFQTGGIGFQFIMQCVYGWGRYKLSCFGRTSS